MKRVLLVALLLGAVQFANGQKGAHHPEIFDLADVTVGAQKLDTLYLFAVGKWSDATIRASAMSLKFIAISVLDFAMSTRRTLRRRSSQYCCRQQRFRYPSLGPS